MLAEKENIKTLDEWFEEYKKKKERWKTIKINSRQDIFDFIKNELGGGYKEVQEGKYKGSMHCNWTITFTKKGKLVMQARSVRKSFEVKTGYDIYDIFAGFEIY